MATSHLDIYISPDVEDDSGGALDVQNDVQEASTYEGVPDSNHQIPEELEDDITSVRKEDKEFHLIDNYLHVNNCNDQATNSFAARSCSQSSLEEPHSEHDSTCNDQVANRFAAQTTLDESVGASLDEPLDEPLHKPLEERYSFKKVDFIIGLLSMCTYIADIGTDIWVAVLHNKNNDTWWLALTLLFVFSPCLILALFNLFIWHDAPCEKIVKKMIPVAIPGGLLYYFVVNLYKGTMAMRESDVQRKRLLTEKVITSLCEASRLRLFETFLEAAPQLVLQLYIMISKPGKYDHLMVTVQWGSVCISLGSLSWALASYYKAIRLEKLKYRVKFRSVTLIFAWRVCTVGARVLAFAVFAVYSGYALLILIGTHYLVMFMMQFTWNVCKLDCYDFGWNIVKAFVLIFCCIDPGYRHTRLKYAAYYTLVYMENVCMLLAWYYYTTKHVFMWHKYVACVPIIGGYLLGILFQVVYYVDFHPNNSSKDPEHPPIRICIPCSRMELL